MNGARKYAGPSLVGHKICSNCASHLPLEQFTRQKSTSDGLKSCCRQCGNEKSSRWRSENPDVKKKYDTQWREENSEYASLWYLENAEGRRNYQARWSTENLDYHSEWLRRNPEKNRASVAKYRALMLGVFVDKVMVSELRKRDGDLCHYCNCNLDFSSRRVGEYIPELAEIEHKVPLSRGGQHSYANCVLSCAKCNREKHAKNYTEFFELLQRSAS